MLITAAILLSCAAGGTGEAAGLPDDSPTGDATAARALDYLRTTRDEIGLDVLVALQIYAVQSGDRRAEGVIEALRGRVPEKEWTLYGRLLGLDKPALSRSSIGALPPVDGTPDPAFVLADDRVQRCPVEILSCRLGTGCREFVELDAWGSVLTHQAVWLLFAHWTGCDAGLDLDERRRTYASRLLAEARADDEPSDLFFERLALLAHLGFRAAVEPAWIEALRGAQQPAGCFPANAEARCHPHPTAVALWALAPARD